MLGAKNSNAEKEKIKVGTRNSNIKNKKDKLGGRKFKNLDSRH